MKEYEVKIKGWIFPCSKIRWINEEELPTGIPISYLSGIYPTKNEAKIYAKVLGGCPCGKGCKPIQCKIIVERRVKK